MDIQIHNSQMQILKYLLLNKSASFSKLAKASKLSTDHFNYHLGCLMKTDLVKKHNDCYELTISGKEFANRMDTEKTIIEKQAKLGVMLIIEKEEDGKEYVLVQKRLKEPYYGFQGFVTGKIAWGENILMTAARELEEETGLTAELEFKYIIHELVYLKENGRLLEDKFFFIVNATKPLGELKSLPSGENRWVLCSEFNQQDKLYYDEIEVYDLMKSGKSGFIEKEFLIEEF